MVANEVLLMEANWGTEEAGLPFNLHREHGAAEQKSWESSSMMWEGPALAQLYKESSNLASSTGSQCEAVRGKTMMYEK